MRKGEESGCGLREVTPVSHITVHTPKRVEKRPEKSQKKKHRAFTPRNCVCHTKEERTGDGEKKRKKNNNNNYDNNNNDNKNENTEKAETPAGNVSMVTASRDSVSPALRPDPRGWNHISVHLTP